MDAGPRPPAEALPGRLLDGPPTATAQRAVVAALGRALDPIHRAERLPPYELLPGPRLRRSWGRCQHFPGGRPSRIIVRCTGMAAPARWRRWASLASTLLHEMAHLQHPNHGAAFWALHRRLVDAASLAGIYDPSDLDLDEGGRGDEKLAGSAASAMAAVARERRLKRAAENRRLVSGWRAGQTALVTASSGPLAGRMVHVVEVRRSRVVVRGPGGLRYLVSDSLLQPAKIDRAVSTGGSP